MKRKALDYLDLLNAGMKELAQSWREMTLFDRGAALKTISQSWRAIQETLQTIETAKLAVVTICNNADALASSAYDMVEVMGALDMRHVPDDQLRDIMDSVSALKAMAEKYLVSSRGEKS